MDYVHTEFAYSIPFKRYLTLGFKDMIHSFIRAYLEHLCTVRAFFSPPTALFHGFARLLIEPSMVALFASLPFLADLQGLKRLFYINLNIFGAVYKATICLHRRESQIICC